MNTQSEPCPFCGERLSDRSKWACGTFKDEDINGEYTTGVQCNANCYREALLKMTPRDRRDRTEVEFEQLTAERNRLRKTVDSLSELRPTENVRAERVHERGWTNYREALLKLTAERAELKASIAHLNAEYNSLQDECHEATMTLLRVKAERDRMRGALGEIMKIAQRQHEHPIIAQHKIYDIAKEAREALGGDDE